MSRVVMEVVILDGVETWIYERDLIQCADCANLAVGDDGSRWCSHWNKKVPMDGFCHLGERSSDER